MLKVALTRTVPPTVNLAAVKDVRPEEISVSQIPGTDPSAVQPVTPLPIPLSELRELLVSVLKTQLVWQKFKPGSPKVFLAAKTYANDPRNLALSVGFCASESRKTRLRGGLS